MPPFLANPCRVRSANGWWIQEPAGSHAAITASAADFINYLAAAQRKLSTIELSEGAAARVRRRLIAAANRIPARWQRPRDAAGRFLAAKNTNGRGCHRGRR